jgi:hypothetical protein
LILAFGVAAGGEPWRASTTSAATLVGALGSAGDDLRCHGTCAPAAMAGSAARPTAIGDGRTARERATQVTITQVSGAGSEGTQCDRRWGKGTTRQPDERALGKGANG